MTSEKKIPYLLLLKLVGIEYSGPNILIKTTKIRILIQIIIVLYPIAQHLKHSEKYHKDEETEPKRIIM